MPHIHEKLDFVSDTFVVNGDAVLLRIHDKHKIWLPPGGHIELDEDPAQAAVREVREEVGLDVTLLGASQSFTDGTHDLIVPRFVNRHRVSDTHEHVSFVYFARSDSRTFVEGETEKSDGIRWFTKDELDDPQYGIRENVRYYAKAALEAAGQ